jgi:putative membrane protein
MKKILLLNLLTVALSLVALPGHAAPPKPTDPQIIEIVITANSGEVAQAKLAEDKTTNAHVTEFAKRMIKDHSASKAETIALAAKLKVQPAESSTSKKLADGSSAAIEKLKKLTGAAFDKAYIDAQVQAHVDVLHMFDKLLIPNARNAELKGLLTKTRPVIAAHLEHARKAQAIINSTPPK